MGRTGIPNHANGQFHGAIGKIWGPAEALGCGNAIEEEAKLPRAKLSSKQIMRCFTSTRSLHQGGNAMEMQLRYLTCTRTLHQVNRFVLMWMRVGAQALDGGSLALLLLEAARGKRLPEGVESGITRFGLIALVTSGIALLVMDATAALLSH
jgi:hypothetical protein